MGTSVFFSGIGISTDVVFSAWCNAWINGWVASGLTRTSDTGQFSGAAAFPAPGSGGVFIGSAYAVFRFSDPLQATHPVFFRIDFGTNGTARPALRLRVGKGTDGAGNISGVLLTQVVNHAMAATPNYETATPYTHLASSGPGYFAFLGFVDHPGSTGGVQQNYPIIIERSRDANGDLTGDGLLVAASPGAYSTSNNSISLTSGSYRNPVWGFNYASGYYFQSTAPVTAPYSINGTPLGASTSIASGGIGPVLPWVMLAPAVAPWQATAIACIPSGDFPGGDFSPVLNGRTITMRPVDAVNYPIHSAWATAYQPGSTSVASSAIGPAIRWE